MTLVLLNTLTRTKTEFVSSRPRHATWYCCGPTVYLLLLNKGKRLLNQVTDDINRGKWDDINKGKRLLNQVTDDINKGQLSN